MTTREFADDLARDLCLEPEVADDLYRRLLLFLVKRDERYGPSDQIDPERAAARRTAELGNYYWMACVVCNHWYGGHESSDDTIMLDLNNGVSVCAHCADEARRLNLKYPDGLRHRKPTGGL